MRQADVEEALKAFYATGDLEPWRKILEAATTDQVEIRATANQLVIKVVSRPAARKLGERLETLRASTQWTQRMIAEEMDLSLSAIIRQFNGNIVSSWPTVAMMVELLGGDPKDFRVDYEAAKAEWKPRGRAR